MDASANTGNFADFRDFAALKQLRALNATLDRGRPVTRPRACAPQYVLREIEEAKLWHRQRAKVATTAEPFRHVRPGSARRLGRFALINSKQVKKAGLPVSPALQPARFPRPVSAPGDFDPSDIIGSAGMSEKTLCRDRSLLGLSP
ncbi:unnamed protein product [Durusdinium trenchii]|uniref:Uncharacterized protein n=1 Tax=Durusdinium trenchii TaxID=1381693 RepID=A0ABP0KPV7_9DINO